MVAEKLEIKYFVKLARIPSESTQSKAKSARFLRQQLEQKSRRLTFSRAGSDPIPVSSSKSRVGPISDRTSWSSSQETISDWHAGRASSILETIGSTNEQNFHKILFRFNLNLCTLYKNYEIFRSNLNTNS